MKSPSPSRRGRPKVYGWVPPLQEISVLECVKFPPWGRVSAPAGVAPRPWRSVCTRPRAINVAPLGCFTGVAVQRLFQPASAFLLVGLGIFRAGAATRSPVEPSGGRALRVGVMAKHVELRNRRLSIH